MKSPAVYLEQSFEHALRGAGWNERTDGRVWQRPTAHGMAQVQHVSDRGTWRHFAVSGGALPTIEGPAILAANRRLAGPLKFVSLGGSRAGCRLDLPETIAAERHDVGQAFDAIERPFDLLARAVDAVVRDTDPALAPAARTPESTSRLLADAGYSASVDGESVHVHITHNGVYRQVHIGRARVSAEIVNLDGYGSGSRTAAHLLVQQANERLPLVRFSLADEGPAIVFAEIDWGKVPISGAWLNLSIACIDAAIALTARELEAVRDPQLGELAVNLSTA